MTWRTERLPEIVRCLAARPRHEALRGHITDILRSGFGIPYSEIGQEVYLTDGTGRIDTLWGATVIELKSDLRRELDDVLARMPAYLTDAATRTSNPRPVTGIATDGATFIAYGLRSGAAREFARHVTDADHPDELLAWLEPLLSDRPDIPPEPRAVTQAFGRIMLDPTCLDPTCLDPTCGSGTFLFHALCRLVVAGQAMARVSRPCQKST